jgi:hypothetical protein
MEPFNRGQVQVLWLLALAVTLSSVALATSRLSHGAAAVLLVAFLVWLPFVVAVFAAALWLTYRAFVLRRARPSAERQLHFGLIAASVCAGAALWLRW